MWLTGGKFKVWMTIAESGWNLWVWFIVHIFYVKVEIIQVPNHVTDDHCFTLRMTVALRLCYASKVNCLRYATFTPRYVK